jgi:hypothetical protein
MNHVTPRALCRFVRDFVDDVVRLVTLAAFFGAALAGKLDGRATVAAVFVLGAPAFVMLIVTAASVLEYASEHVPKPSLLFGVFILGVSLLVSAGIFFVA